MKMLGLIGGMSWIATIDYYRLINEQVNQRLGGSEYARCIIYSFNYGEIMALNATQDWDGVLERVVGACACLREGGAEGLVLCANTLHLIADRLQDRVGLPVIHIAEAAAGGVQRAGLRRVALLGTRFTMEMDFFKERLARHRIETAIPAEADREFIHASIFEELGKGDFRPETKARYLRIIASMAEQGAEGAILGCTEIPLLVKQEDCPVPIFDTTALHAAAAVSFALG